VVAAFTPCNRVHTKKNSLYIHHKCQNYWLVMDLIPSQWSYVGLCLIKELPICDKRSLPCELYDA